MADKKEKNIPLEELFEALEEVVEKLEGQDTSLEDSFKLYQKGVALVQESNQKIDKIEKEIMVLSENGDGYDL